jgi:pimeloyl-ACP methyl ester carboxylesterase
MGRNGELRSKPAPTAIDLDETQRGDTMFSAIAVLLTAAATLTADKSQPVLLRKGGDPARGLLVNHSPGRRPFDSPDPRLPTVVFIHGITPTPRLVHFTMAERFAESLARRGGAQPFNVLGWDWNAATLESLRSAPNSEAAVRQGPALAWALWRAGIDPARTHLIGHSSGAMVATSAARTFVVSMGRPVAHLTLLEPATYYHAIIFERLGAGSLSPVVENYWASGPSAYGNEVALPGIRNYRVDGAGSYMGVVCPLQSDHIHIVRWYLDTIERPGLGHGFNLSRLLTLP